MVARIHAGGKSFGGLVSYLTEEDGKQPKKGGRVGFVAVENLVTRDPLAAARVMSGTAYDAPRPEAVVRRVREGVGSSPSRSTTTRSTGALTSPVRTGPRYGRRSRPALMTSAWPGARR